MRRFEFSEGSSNKFWEIEQDDSRLVIRWGKIGTAGQSQTKAFADAAKAAAALGKLVNEKIGKGYAEVPVEAVAAAPGAATVVSEASVAVIPAEQPAATETEPASVSPVSPPWLSGGDPIRIHDLEALALSSRRFPKPVAGRDPDLYWQFLCERLQAEVIIQYAGHDPVWRAAADEARQRVADARPDGSAASDAVLLALAVADDRYHAHEGQGVAYTHFLVARRGLRLALTALLLAEQWLGVDTQWQGRGQKRTLSLSHTTDEVLAYNWAGFYSQAEWLFRDYLAVAPLAEWEACVADIREALPGIPACRQPLFGLLLPDLPSLSDELVMALSGPQAPQGVFWLQMTARDPQALKLAARVRTDGYYGTFLHQEVMVATLVRERGLEAVGILEGGADAEAAAKALAGLGVPRALQALARTASGSKASLARFVEACSRWPLAATAAVAELMACGGKDGDWLSPTLSRLLAAHERDVPALRPWLTGGAAQVVDRLLAQLAGPAEVAAAADLPPVLANPPWLAARKRERVVLNLSPLSLAPVEQWNAGERETLADSGYWRRDLSGADTLRLINELGFETRYLFSRISGPDKAAVEAVIRRAVAAVEAADLPALLEAWQAYRGFKASYWYSLEARVALLLPGEMGLAFWNALAGENWYSAGVMVARYGVRALPGLLLAIQQRPAQDMVLAMGIGAVELAPVFARAFVKLKTARDTARAWLLRFPEHAIAGLLAPAVGKAGEARDCAAVSLRFLNAQGHGALIQSVADRYGQADVSEAVRAMLDEDPLDRFPSRIGKLPEFWQASGWRRPVLVANSKALPDNALTALGVMLRFPVQEGVYPGIDQVRAACAPESLADFAWDVFTAWLTAASPSKESWAMTALGLLGNNDTARRMTPLIRAWPGESQHQRAVAGLDVLALIGTDVALMLLNGIAQKVKFKGLQDKAREKITQIAEARQLTPEELEDRLAPDFGLDAQGSLRLDFGPRQFRVGFDEALKPYVRDDQGARLPDLPKPKKTDDAALAAEAGERFKTLKKDVRTVAAQQVLRLETAMCTRRRWTEEVFRQFLVEHPLVRHLAQRLVWGVYTPEDGGGDRLQACFRVAEEGSYTNVDDDAWTLPEAADLRIGIPHRLEMDPAEAAAFGQLFADYELLQPFPQLGRETHVLTPKEREGMLLERWKGVTVPTGKVLGLVNRGWRRGEAQDGGGIWYFTKPLPDKRQIELSLDPGIIVGMVDEYPEQTLQEISVGLPSSWGQVGQAEKIATLDAIAVSELIRDMEGLRA